MDLWSSLAVQWVLVSAFGVSKGQIGRGEVYGWYMWAIILADDMAEMIVALGGEGWD